MAAFQSSTTVLDSILFRDAKRAKDTAEAMKITAQDLFKFRIVDAIVPAPLGGAHRDPKSAIEKVGAELRAMMPWISAGKKKVSEVSGG